jgi:hypothetical protein
MSLPKLTPEQREEALEKSRLTKVAKKAYAEKNLKLSFADEPMWRELAQNLGVRLPQRFDTGPKGVKKVAKKLGINVNEWVEYTGFTTLTALCNTNKTWPSWAICGLMLEWHQEIK